MDLTHRKTFITACLVSFFALLLAYSFDQYYIYGRQLFFLSRPVQVINHLLNRVSQWLWKSIYRIYHL